MIRIPNLLCRLAALASLLLWSFGTLAEHYTVPLLVPAGTTSEPQGVLRILNATEESGAVEIYAIDDAGTRSGPATFTLTASAAAEFTATDLQSGNASLGLTGGIGTEVGDARLLIETDLDIVPLALVRAVDGTLSAMHDTVRAAASDGSNGYTYDVPVFNPSTEMTQVSRLRLINPGDAVAVVTIGGRDDSGATATGGDVTLTLAAGGAKTLTAQQLEAGDTDLTGQLGAGTGKWRLTVSSDRPLEVVNIVASSAGSWNNLSTVAAGAAPADALAFAGRFAGEGVVFESRAFTATTEFFADGRFAETLEYFTFVWQAGGSYDYVSAGPHAGRVTTERDDGDVCAVDMNFASRSGGRFATHCAGGGADDLWFGGRWFVGDGGTGTAYGERDELPGVPTSGAFEPANVMDGTVNSTAAGTRIDLDAGGYFELADGTRYTCAAAGGCEIVNGTVTRGSVTGRAGGDGDVDRFPRFGAAAGPGDRSYTVGSAIGTLRLPAAAGGNPPLTYSLSPEVPGLSFNAATRRLSGTPTAAGSYAMTYTVTDVDGDTDTLRFAIAVRDAQSPDLTVGPVSVSDNSPSTGATFTLSATVQNRGDARSAATTLRYYRSSNATISMFDAAVGTDPVGALAASGTSAESISLTAPSSAGTYYYGACVDTVPDESSTTNNCSEGVRVDVSSGGAGDVELFPRFGAAAGPGDGSYTVGVAIGTLTLPEATGGNPPLTYSLSPEVPGLSFNAATRRLSGTPTAAGTYAMTYTVTDADGDTDTLRFTIAVGDAQSPDLTVGPVSVSDNSPSTGAPFTLSATVQNRGDARSAATTLRYYRSSNATISRGDAAVGTDPVGALAASGTSAESVSLTAPSSAGTFYYGACVDTVPDESSTTNNCSEGVRVDVSSAGTGGTDLSAPPVDVSGTQITVTLRLSGQAGGPVAFQAAVRLNGGAWQSSNCTERTFDPGFSEGTIEWKPTLSAVPPAGTVIEARYRQYDGGSCSGSPGPWSPIGSFTVSGGGGGSTGGGVGTDGYCRDGDTVAPGGSCDIYNTSNTFEVQSSGRACIGGFCTGRGGRLSLISGSWRMVANGNSDGSWTIENVEPDPPSNGQGLAIGGVAGFVLEGL